MRVIKSVKKRIIVSIAITQLGQGEDLVVLHGWGMNRHVWSTVQTQLSQHFRLWLVDLPGFGDSYETPLATSVNAVAEQLLPHLPEQFHVLGWSMGGLVATAITAEHPERVKTVITVASSPYFLEQANWPGIKPRLMAQLEKDLQHDFRKTVERFLALQAMGSKDAKQQVKQLKQWLFESPLASAETLSRGLTLLEQTDLRETLQSIQVPMLRLYGRLDGLVPLNAAQATGKLAPHTSSYVFSESAHAPFITEPELFVEQVTGFLTSN